MMQNAKDTYGIRTGSGPSREILGILGDLLQFCGFSWNICGIPRIPMPRNPTNEIRSNPRECWGVLRNPVEFQGALRSFRARKEAYES